MSTPVRRQRNHKRVWFLISHLNIPDTNFTPGPKPVSLVQNNRGCMVFYLEQFCSRFLKMSSQYITVKIGAKIVSCLTGHTTFETIKKIFSSRLCKRIIRTGPWPSFQAVMNQSRTTKITEYRDKSIRSHYWITDWLV